MQEQAIRLPENCGSLEEIRTEIDRIDRSIIRAIGERKRYVLAAAGFKTSPNEIAARDRLTSMFLARRAWAGEEGLNPNVIEMLYRDLVTHFIICERAQWETEFRLDRGANCDSKETGS